MFDWFKRLFGIDTYDVVFTPDEWDDEFKEKNAEEIEKDNEGFRG